MSTRKVYLVLNHPRTNPQSIPGTFGVVDFQSVSVFESLGHTTINIEGTKESLDKLIAELQEVRNKMR